MIPTVMTFLTAISLAQFPPPSDLQELLPRGGRLLHFADRWSASDPFLGSVVRSGVRISFLHGPPDPFDHGEPSFDREITKLVDSEVESMLDKLAIMEIPEDQAHLICRMFLVDKKGGGSRPVLNLKPLNRHTMPKQ
jgi:hypothetical protein